MEIALGESESAISLLRVALDQAHPKKDLVLYRRILANPATAVLFAERLSRRLSCQAQAAPGRNSACGSGLSIGAGQIQPYESLLPGVLDGSTQALLATEIRASGRQEDVDALTRRLEQPRYPLVVIHGPSGVGKKLDSLCRAGSCPVAFIS